MIRIRTGSRLHFGLLAPFQPGGERAGGCGLIVENPGIDLTVEPADTWQFEGCHTERVRRIVAELQAPDRLGPLPPLRLEVVRAAREHVGLGIGTQLTLAVARALVTSQEVAMGATATGATGSSLPVRTRETLAPSAGSHWRTSRQWHPGAEVRSQTEFGNEGKELARLTGRGRRSLIGVRGFLEGGFLVDAGAEPVRCEFPKGWTFLLLTPNGMQGAHGPDEQAVFSNKLPANLALTHELESLLRNDLLPALQGQAFEPFAAALTEYNRRAGEFYQAVQGGCYSTSWITTAVELLRQRGVRGVGQTSWGPTVFALLPERTAAAALCSQLATDAHFQAVERVVTAARNEGCTLLPMNTSSE